MNENDVCVAELIPEEGSFPGYKYAVIPKKEFPNSESETEYSQIGKNVNKVIFNSDTIIDLTEDTVTSDKMLIGSTAHDASGTQIEGECMPVDLSAVNIQEDDVVFGKIGIDSTGRVFTGSKMTPVLETTSIDNIEYYGCYSWKIALNGFNNKVGNHNINALVCGSFGENSYIAVGTEWVYLPMNVKPTKENTLKVLGSAFIFKHNYSLGTRNYATKKIARDESTGNVLCIFSEVGKCVSFGAYVDSEKNRITFPSHNLRSLLMDAKPGFVESNNHGVFVIMPYLFGEKTSSIIRVNMPFKPIPNSSNNATLRYTHGIVALPREITVGPIVYGNGKWVIWDNNSDTTSIHVLISTDNGLTWVEKSGGESTSYSGRASVKFATFNGSDFIFVGTDGYTCMTSDFETFTLDSGLWSTKNVEGIVWDYNLNRLLIYCDNHLINYLNPYDSNNKYIGSVVKTAYNRYFSTNEDLDNIWIDGDGNLRFCFLGNNSGAGTMFHTTYKFVINKIQIYPTS